MLPETTSRLLEMGADKVYGRRNRKRAGIE